MLFADVLESRTFRNPQTVEKYSSKQLGEIFFLFMMVLNIMVHVEPDTAKKYARATLQYPAFDGIRFTATDLCNLITALYRAQKYLGEKSVPLPVLDIKRYLRGLNDEVAIAGFTSQVFLKCQQVLKIQDGQLLALRRATVDFSNLSKYEKLTTARKIYQLIRTTSYNGDLIIQYHKWLEEFDQ